MRAATILVIQLKARLKNNRIYHKNRIKQKETQSRLTFLTPSARLNSSLSISPSSPAISLNLASIHASHFVSSSLEKQ